MSERPTRVGAYARSELKLYSNFQRYVDFNGVEFGKKLEQICIKFLELHQLIVESIKSMLLQTFQIIYLLSKEKIMPEGGHSKEKSPSKKGKHEKGEARRKQDQEINPEFKEYKKKGGKLAKGAWMKAGKPKK